VIGTRQIGAPDRSGEERVADKQVLPDSAFPYFETHPAGAVAGRVMYPDLVVPKIDRGQIVKDIDRWRLSDCEAKHPPLLDRVFV